MHILFVCDPAPNYVPDLLLHGLRRLLGPAVIDFPRKTALYQGRLGQPYLAPVPGLFPPDDSGAGAIDRSDIAAKLTRGGFDLVFCDARALAANMHMLSLAPMRLGVIDGEDRPAEIAPGPYVIFRRETDGRDAAAPLPMSLPEPVLAMIARHDETPKTHGIGFLGSRSPRTPARNAMLDALERRFPSGLIGAWDTDAGGGWTGRDAYYRAMQSCQVVLSLPGAGLDTFRYWESAGCHALHLAQRTPLFIPDDFREGREVLRFDTAAEIDATVDRVLAGRHDWRGFAERSRAWLHAHHTTERRAVQAIDVLRRAFGMIPTPGLAQAS